MGRVFIGLLLVLLISTATIGAKSVGKNPLQDYWMGIYCGDTKIGYSHVATKETVYEGKDALSREETVVLAGRAAGNAMRLRWVLTSVVDRDYNTLHETMQVLGSSAGYPEQSQFLMDVKYGAEAAVMKITRNGETNERVIPRQEEREAGEKLASRYDFGTLQLKVGEVYSLNHPYLQDIRFKDKSAVFAYDIGATTVYIARKEKLQVDGKEYGALMVSETGKHGEVRRWHLPSGGVLKAEIPMDHITLVREPEEKARAAERGDGPVLDKLLVPVRELSGTNGKANLNQDYWMDIYCKDKKIGHSHVVIKQDKYGGKDVLARQEEILLQGRVRSGKSTGMKVTHKLLADKDFHPVYEDVRMLEMDGDRPCGEAQRYVRTMTSGGAKEVRTANGESSENVSPVSEEDAQKLSLGLKYGFGCLSLPVGGRAAIISTSLRKVAFPDGNLEFIIEGAEATLTVDGSEKLTVDGRKQNTVVTTESTPLGAIRRWQLESGEVVKEEMPVYQVTLIRVSEAKAREIQRKSGPSQSSSEKQSSPHR